MLTLGTARDRRLAQGTGVRREADRRIALGSLLVAGGFMVLAVAVALLGRAGPAGLGWLPLHLLLAGGAGTAIAGMMPFFSAALAAAAPADPRLRIAGVALVAIGAAAVASRADPLVAPGPLPAIGGLAFIGGMVLVGLATVGAARRGLATRRRLVTIAYVAALLDVLGGATLGTLAVAGNGAVLVAWSTLRPAHAWLNLLGFVTLVVAGTLLHLLPTIAGTRIVERASARIAIAGLAAGPPTVAGGFVIAALGGSAAGDVVVRVGAAIALVGAIALGADSIAVARARGHWTSDAGWHALATGSLLAAVAWFVIGLGAAALRVLVAGAVPDAWSTSLVAVALGLGWIAQAFIGSWTHLLPAIGPGGPTGHADRRRILARGAIPRLVALNVGVALLALGSGLQNDALAETGMALAGGATAAALGLGAAALLDPLGRAVAGRG